MSLSEVLKDSQIRQSVIADCCKLVDDEVAKKSGLGGMMIKTGHRAVKGIQPGFIQKVVTALLDRWTAALDPIWEEADSKGQSPVEHFSTERSRVADALLSVTDKKAANANSKVVASTYKKLRPSGKKHVEEAVPGLAALLAKHIR